MSYVHIEVDTHIGPVGAVVSGVDLSEQLNAEVVAEIHAAWLQHHVLFFVTKPCRRPLRRALPAILANSISTHLCNRLMRAPMLFQSSKRRMQP
ncbi:MAG: hypothetical protein CM15mP120_19380 [Pseudomonadota bacterium]|nr:MAG: hypothetical protein CM15mP120_19380 [Pseudomonadota bacterium]